MRMKAKTVTDVKSPKIQQVIKSLQTVIDRYDAIGLCAPQIGESFRIVCVQCTNRQLVGWPEDVIKERGMDIIPKRILINPVIEIVDKTLVSQREGCCSVHGYSAFVPRAKEVTVKALDENGDSVNWRVKNWTARIVQHEIEHLDGTMFTDKMVLETFMLNYWKTVNSRNGQFTLSFGGMQGPKKWRQYYFPLSIIHQPKF